MKANEFVKKFGVERAKQMVNADDSVPALVFATTKVSILDLKRLAESHELVSNFGGLKRAKRILKKAYTSFNTMISVVWNDKPFQCNIQKLENAIADVESCQ